VIGYRFLGVPVPEGVHVKAEERGPVWLRDKVLTAEVLKVEKHPNADKLKLVTVNYGAAPHQVVTGAPNINLGDDGQKVIIGIAREVAALTGTKLKRPDTKAPRTGESIEGKVKVSIEDSKLSARYQALLIRGVRIGPSPGWMQRRLTYAGMRPISNIVDVTNYVMLEWGQPLHAFDYDLLVQRAKGGTPVITVRSARPGEVLTTLDKVRRELTPENLVIADSAGPIALAGVMGGAETEVSDKTKNILLESANFDFRSI